MIPLTLSGRIRSVGVGWVPLIISVAVSVCSAQQTDKGPPFEVHGIVVEAEVLRPIPNADVSLIRLPANAGPRVISARTPKDVVQTTKTDAIGAFVFTVEDPGEYQIEVHKDGYRPAQQLGARATITLGRGSAVGELKFTLVGSCELSSRVIDQETEKPIAMLKVFVGQRRYGRGRATAMPVSRATTDRQGRFVVTELQPGDYLLRAESRFYDQRDVDSAESSHAEPQMLTRFSDQDLAGKSWDYEQTWWPDGVELKVARPITLRSGEAVDLGDLPARKIRVYSVRGSVLAPDCGPSTLIWLNSRPVSNESGMTGREGTVPCGKEFLMRGFPPGTYCLEAVVEGQDRASRQRGSETFVVVDENVEVSIPVTRGVDVTGRVVLAEGASPVDFKALNLRLTPNGWVSNIDEVDNPVDEQGGFRLVNVALREQQLYVSGLKSPYYIKEVRYNGNRVVDNLFSLEGNAPSHSLEIVVDDKPAGIRGTVMDGNNPASEPHVVAIRWPPNANQPYLSIAAAADGDKDGRFQVLGLPPGEYAVFAVGPTARARLEEPNVLEQMLGGAQRVTLGERASQEVMLKLAYVP